MTIASRLLEIKKALPVGVTLVAVSKTKPVEDILEAYEAGQRIFGENKIQEMSDKFEVLPRDIQWHMIGHVQTNKVKYMAPFVSLIHGVDSFRLLREIDKQAKRNERVIPCLLQVYIADEESKFGLEESELDEILSSPALRELKNIKIVGLMAMATFTDDQTKIKGEFDHLNTIFHRVQLQYKELENVDFKELSIGMSNDYITAISSGSTMIRIGSTIFGSRNY
ncbi:YggS family pyridoxal phosphate-dependent enzyme [Flavobacterium sp. HSC-61S13]|uniref:YggS family pyridoxal phosphate-dependent enzyme n=1 Tax=Flavobacterium sp. HSC-61S13 TaxID=2910963 RepID=UPI00209D2DB4|nr:YggS family pyridoxal phosphate-dependent enzyme [Flavobacterium sp. HSC-61S13]MCP1994554.1 pyridoxal phosphate enzyme (YggS family) [Flavobacterium sp. HSC-61S13]